MIDSRCRAAPSIFSRRSAWQWREAVTPQQIGEAEDGVHRRADFVAHVGQECALGPVGRLGSGSRLVQFGGALGHQFLEMVTVRIELCAHALFLGNVLLHRHVMGNRAIRLAQGRNDGELDILAAVFSAVDKFALPGSAVAQRLPQPVETLSRGLARLQHARVPADRFLAAVARVVFERLIDIFDVAVEARDDDALGALFHRLGELPQLRLGEFAFGDVQVDTRQRHRLPRIVVLRAPSADQPADLTGFQPNPVFHTEAFAGCEVAFPLGIDQRQIVGVYARTPVVVAAQAAWRHTVQPLAFG